MKKYAITIRSVLGTMWFFDTNLPNEWWTRAKWKATLYDQLKVAEAQAFELVKKFPEEHGNIALYEGEEKEFVRPANGGGFLGAVLGAVFGGPDARKPKQGRVQDQAKAGDGIADVPRIEGDGGEPPRS